jgi:hypothetical protein
LPFLCGFAPLREISWFGENRHNYSGFRLTSVVSTCV